MDRRMAAMTHRRLCARCSFVIFRPYWNVPPISIVKKELVGHLKGDDAQAYLDKHNYEVLDHNGKDATGWTADDLAHSRFSIRQRPGAGNSLGLVKFLFPNEYNVYMHSTPEMNFFNLTRRDKSHGCIRLNDAEKMANWVLRDQGGDWTLRQNSRSDVQQCARRDEPTGNAADSTAGERDLPDSDGR